MHDSYDFLRRVYLFRDVSDDDLSEIAKLCVEEDFTPGDILFDEGSVADKFYIIIEGRVEVWKNYYEPKPELLAVHAEGHMIGEMALIDDLPRSATLVARERTKVFVLSKAEFRDLIKRNTSIALSVMTSLSFIVRSSNETFVSNLEARNRELEKAYAELKSAQSELLGAERLSTLGKFSSLILHDIRNPITVLQGLCEIILMYSTEPARIEESIVKMKRELKRLNNLANEFLDYSRGDIRLNLTLVSIDQFFDKVAQSIGERFTERGIRIEILCGFHEPALIDEERMLRVFLNLADNARKAMPKGGLFTLGAERRGARLELAVKDSGLGMDRETLDHMYEPFYSRSSEGGTGLGMLIVKNVVEAHEGSVSITSSPGNGTKVLISLPIRI
jgi:signal transduction histidine kinase